MVLTNNYLRLHFEINQIMLQYISPDAISFFPAAAFDRGTRANFARSLDDLVA
jgi:hypothetical protein